MGRRAKTFPTKLIRACVRETIIKAVKIKLSERNYFNPDKPAHGDMSNLIENLLLVWLKGRISEDSYRKLLLTKHEKEVSNLDLSTPKKELSS